MHVGALQIANCRMIHGLIIAMVIVCKCVIAQEEPAPAIQIVERPSLLDQKFVQPYLIDVDRPIDGLFTWYINNRLDKAEALKADLVIIRLTTPGGDLEYSLELARRLRDIDWAKTVVWIPKEAISGGAIVSLGADAVFMQDTAMFGDAGPIMFGPGGQFVHAEEKIVSYTATAVRELASSSGRPTAVAEAMVDRKLKVFPATDKESGKTVFLTEAQSSQPEVLEQYDVGQPIEEAGNDRFLTVGARRAQELQLCDGVFASETDLLARLTSATVRSTEMDWKDRMVFTLNHPWVTALLLIFGILGLFYELTAPGVGIGALLGLFCFGVFFWSHFLGGTAGWLEVLFVVLGLTCLLVEVFVLPGMGVFGIAGAGLIAMGLIMATQDFLIPETTEQWKQFRTNGLTVLAAFGVLGLLLAAQLLFFDSLPGLSKFQLRPEAAPSVNNESHARSDVLVSKGDRGVSHSDLRPSGMAKFGEQVVDVLSEGEYIERGTPIVVIKIEGNFVTVRRVT